MLRQVFWGLALFAGFVALLVAWIFPLSACGVTEAERNFRASVPLQVCAANGNAGAKAWLGIIVLSNAEFDPPYGDGLFLMDHLGEEEMTARGLRLIDQAASGGIAIAQNEIGNFHRYGHYGYEADGEQAEAWFEKAMASGDSMAAFNLAWIHAEGEVVEVDFDKAVRFLKLSADMGYEVARCALDDLAEEGASGEPDADLAALQAIFGRSYPQDCLTDPFDPAQDATDRLLWDMLR